MAEPRAVRIARSATPSSGAAETGRFIPNRAGTARGWRLFVLFVAVLAVIYLVFVALALSSPTPGVRNNPLGWATFSGLATLLALWGWAITLGRAPRGATPRGEDVLVEGRTGRRYRVAAGALAQATVAHRYPAGPLSPEPTEFVVLRTSDGAQRTFLVGESFFEDLTVR